ncbi:metalloendopeptidase [Aureococcus anophagefferens]|nr:metalloendopeptidase [Aureococcus anophagefferens]
MEERAQLFADEAATTKLEDAPSPNHERWLGRRVLLLAAAALSGLAAGARLRQRGDGMATLARTLVQRGGGGLRRSRGRDDDDIVYCDYDDYLVTAPVDCVPNNNMGACPWCDINCVSDDAQDRLPTCHWCLVHCATPFTYAPTTGSTAIPTKLPSSVPSYAPTYDPTTYPTSLPYPAPTKYPTGGPSAYPTAYPTLSPTTADPTGVPTAAPSYVPTSVPTAVPSSRPTGAPSYAPTTLPSNAPTPAPTGAPSYAPSSSRDEDHVSIYGSTDKYGDDETSLYTYASAAYRDFIVYIRVQRWVEKATYFDDQEGYACKVNTESSGDTATLVLREYDGGEDHAGYTIDESDSFTFNPNVIVAEASGTDNTYSSGYIGVGSYRDDYGPHYWGYIRFDGTPLNDDD